MLYPGKELFKFSLRARNGNVGTLYDIYFDDRSWNVQYLVVDARSWLRNRLVLVAPAELTKAHDDTGSFTTSLSLEQIKASPTPASDPPVSRQFEKSLRTRYSWTSIWNSPTDAWARGDTFPKGDRHLRSLREVCRYRIHASDGMVGEVADLLIDPETWCVTHLVADTRLWWPGKQVLVDKRMILSVNWFAHEVAIGTTRRALRSSPLYRPGITGSESSHRQLSV